MGFDSKWVSLTMHCITSISYSVLINGKIGPNFIPERGIRQEDPFSPYLFFICIEGFASLIHEAKEMGRLNGANVCKGGPSMTNLFFTDDSMVFGEASIASGNLIKSILQRYECYSRQ